MPISTNLDISPYYDDYATEELKNYMRVLFKPSVSVQTRELNIMQDMFQAQIEAFGDNIYKDGSVISGCNYQPYNPYPYIKLTDLDVFNNINIPSNFIGYSIINNITGVSAVIVNFLNGFETTPPNLKTLYLNYKTGNNNSGTFTFNSGDLLTIYNPVTNPIHQINVANGGIGYSNSDTVIVLSAITCVVTYGSLSNTNVGQFILDPSTSANVQITFVDANTYASSNQLILTLAPRIIDLSNSGSSSANWTVTVGETLQNIGNTFGIMVVSIIGNQASANIITNGIGSIIGTNMISPGTGYFPTVPYVAIKSINNPNIGSANLVALNYLTQVSVSGDAQSVGNGYAAGVTQGTIYQKGYFLPVTAQQIIVDPYDTQPNGVVMGFTTTEAIITSDQDQTLLDNVNNTQNQQAPGADRLQMIPVLTLVTTAAANSNSQFLPYATWNDGLLVLLNDQTTFNTVGAAIAQAINDSDGDFVTEPFLVTTQSPANTQLEGEFFNVVVDQGVAYINGYKVATVNNYITADTKGIANGITNNHIVSLNYGNYLTCNNVAGFMQFNTGATINLQDTAKSWYANVNQAMNPAGNTVGNAMIRSVQWIGGEPGTANAQYAMYLFNVTMANGFNFANVGGIYYANSSANSGLADVVLTVANTGQHTAIINTGSTVITSPNGEPQGQAIVSDQSPTTLPDTLCFYTGVQSLKNANNIQYTYYTCNTSASCNVGNGAAANAVATITLASGQFPWTGALTNGDMEQVYVVPYQTNMVWAGSASGNTNGNTVTTGNSTNLLNQTYLGNVSTANTTFLTSFQPGDYVYVAANATANEIHQIQYIINNNAMVFTANVTFANTACVLYRVFPENVPVPFGTRANLTASVTGSTLSLNFGTPFTFTGTTQLAVYYPVQVNPSGALSKTVLRNQFVVHNTATSPANTVGPWSLGVPDAFRLRGVYITNSTLSNTGTNYIANFYLDIHQKADYYGISRVYLNPTSGLSINSSCYILFQFDYMTSPGVGFYDTLSYIHTSDANTLFIQDSQPLSNLATVLNSFEVPIFFDNNGTQYDLLQQFDFRPYAANTGAPGTSPGAAYSNPNTTLSFTGGEQQFPVPGTQFECNLEYWMGRIDSLFVDQLGNFTVGAGTPAPTVGQQNLPIQPQGTMKIVDMEIPPYPNLPTNLGLNIAQLLNNGVLYGDGITPTRIPDQTIQNLSNTSSIPFNQPAVYTMADIGTLDRRLANVEYYITLDLLTQSATTLQIPSTANPGSNRFQYGVFVDNFSTSAFSALTNPEYAATYIKPNIVPPRMLWDINLQGFGNPSWIPVLIASQPFATTGSILDPLGLGPICALNLANTVAYEIIFRNATNLEQINPFSNTDIVSITMASIAEITGQIINNNNLASWLQQAASNPYVASLFNVTNLPGQNFAGALTASSQLSAQYNPANQTLTIFDPNGSPSHGITTTISGISQTVATAFAELLTGAITPIQFATTIAGNPNVQPLSSQYIAELFNPPVSFYFYNYNQGVQYQIFQGTTLVADTGGVSHNQPQPLSNSDIVLLTGPTADYWFNDNTQAYLTNPAGNTFITGAGKITFNYNPAAGSNFTIKTTMSKNSVEWRWVLAYPVNGGSLGCVPPTAPTVTLTETFNPIYQTYAVTSTCTNGAEAAGQISILSGVSISRSGVVPPKPSASIVPFNTSQDWAGAADTTITTPLIGYAPNPAGI